MMNLDCSLSSSLAALQERVLGFILKDQSDVVSKQALIAFLQQEYEVSFGSYHLCRWACDDGVADCVSCIFASLCCVSARMVFL